MDFNFVSGFEVSLEAELTLVLVNEKGLGGRGTECGGRALSRLAFIPSWEFIHKIKQR